MASDCDEVHLSFTRSGGLLGQPLPPVELDESEFSPAEAAAWAEVMRSGVLDREVIGGGPGLGGDEYQYDLTIRRGEDEHAMRFTEFDVPAELAELIALLEQRAETAAHGASER